jgi:hypothetical protein
MPTYILKVIHDTWCPALRLSIRSNWPSRPSGLSVMEIAASIQSSLARACMVVSRQDMEKETPYIVVKLDR